MSLVFADGFELASNYGYGIFNETDLYAQNGTNQVRVDYNSPSPISGYNNSGTAAIAQNQYLALNIPEAGQITSGIVSFLRYEQSSNMSGTVGQTIIALRSGTTEIVSIRYSNRVANFPYYYIVYELVVGGVQVGTFSFSSVNEWIRWAIVWDSSGPNVSASLYLNGTAILSGIGGTSGANSSLTNVYLSSRQSYTYYDLVAVWDDAVADLSDATGSYWMFMLKPNAPNVSTFGDWTSFYSTNSPNGNISDRLSFYNDLYGAQTTVADSPLELSFPIVSGYLGDQILKVNGIMARVKAFSNNPSLSSLKLYSESEGTASDQTTKNITTRGYLNRLDLTDPATGTSWTIPNLNPTILLDPTGDGGFETGAAFADNSWYAENEWIGGDAVTLADGEYNPGGWIEFDGTGERISFGQVPGAQFQFSDTFSVSVWTQAANNTRGVLVGCSAGVWDSSANGWALFGGTNITIAFFDGNVRYQKYFSTTLQDDWNHVLAVWSNGNLSLWINGVSVSVQEYSTNGGVIGTLTYSGEPLTIGAQSDGGEAKNQKLADVAIWSSDQSSNKAAIYNSGQRHNLMNLANPPDVFYAPLSIVGDSLTSANGISELVGPTLVPAENNLGTGINMEESDLKNPNIVSGGSPYTAVGSYVEGDYIPEAYVRFLNGDEYIRFGYIPEARFQPSDTFSISTWIRSSSGGAQNIFTYGTNNFSSGIRGSWTLEFSNSGTYLNWFHTGNPSYSARGTSVRINDGYWHHVLGVWNNGSVSIYIDGVLQNSNLNTGASTQEIVYTLNDEASIGAAIYPALQPTYGSIKDVAVWSSDQSLNAADIYNGGIRHDLMNLASPPNVFYAPLCSFGDNLTENNGVLEKVGPTLSPSVTRNGTGVNLVATNFILNPYALSNGWYLGGVGDFVGNRGAFLSNDGGLTNSAYIEEFGYSHIYRDIVIPPGITAISLSMIYGYSFSSSSNNLSVFISDPSFTPVAGEKVDQALLLRGTVLYKNGPSGSLQQLSNSNLPGGLPGSYAKWVNIPVVENSTIRLIISAEINSISGTVITPPTIDSIKITEADILNLDNVKVILEAGA